MFRIFRVLDCTLRIEYCNNLETVQILTHDHLRYRAPRFVKAHAAYRSSMIHLRSLTMTTIYVRFVANSFNPFTVTNSLTLLTYYYRYSPSLSFSLSLSVYVCRDTALFNNLVNTLCASHRAYARVLRVIPHGGVQVPFSMANTDKVTRSF